MANHSQHPTPNDPITFKRTPCELGVGNWEVSWESEIGRWEIGLEDLFEAFGGTREDGARAFLDDRPLYQVRILHHQRDDLIV